MVTRNAHRTATVITVTTTQSGKDCSVLSTEPCFITVPLEEIRGWIWMEGLDGEEDWIRMS